jgi:PPOX class probable F420-dependent enzyme
MTNDTSAENADGFMQTMTSAQADTFLRETRIASFTTLTKFGRPVTTPVWFEWDGKVARVFSERGAAKVRRIDANAAVALTVYDGVGVPEAWVSLEGTATVLEEDATGLITRLAKRYYPAARAETVLKQWLVGGGDPFAVIAITPERIRSYRTAW